jgi:hypothetical protein
MNYLIFFIILNLVLISRLRFTLRDKGITAPSDLLRITLIPLLALPLLQINTGWFLLAGYLLLHPLITYFSESNRAELSRNRMFTLLLHIVVIGVFSGIGGVLQVSDWAGRISAETAMLLFPETYHLLPGPVPLLAILFGFLLILNEANLLIRYLLEKLELAPIGDNSREIDDRQFRTGRVIGFLERIFVYLFVMAGQYTAIGFILAAKGVVRYPEFGNRTFAEYILIGTLLSALSAMGVAFLVSWFA